MRYKIEFAPESLRDLELIFDHLVDSYMAFGDTADEAIDRAAHRINAIRKATARLAIFPVRGAARDDVLPGLRSLAIDRATYWFEIDETAKKIAVLAVFFGGQDDIRRMLVRLLRTDKQP
jgi:toxin ParE1/3/4